MRSQAIDTEFGKNRVQYHDDFKYWSKYESANFITYWYGKSRNVGKIAAQLAEYDHNEIRKIIEHKINDKIEILVFTDVDDLKQSNLGSEDAFVSKSGETKIVGKKMFVYFDGNHHHLRKQIREGIARVYFNAMMFGANFQEIIQNAVLLEVPEWFASGIVSYAGAPYDIFIDDELRDIFYRDKNMYEFEKLLNKHPRAGGHALWHYVGVTYGKSSISNLLYLTRISRDVENAFEFVLNTSLEQVLLDAENFYQSQFDQEKGKFDLLRSKQKLKLKNKKYVPVSHLSLSPDGRYLAYAYNKSGKVIIRIKDMNTGKSTKIFQRGYVNLFQETDYGYPPITWKDDGSELTFCYNIRDKVFLYKHFMSDGSRIEQLIPEAIQRIYSIDYLDDRYYIMSAATEGLSDLFVYDTQERQHFNITDDFYDDLDVQFTTYDGQKGILFSSNRSVDHILPSKIDTILPIENFDIFFLPFKGKESLDNKSPFVERLTITPAQNERYPMTIADDQIIYLSDGTGLINTYAYSADGNTKVLNNHGRNIIRHTITDNGSQYALTLYNNGAYETHLFADIDKNNVEPYRTQLVLQSIEQDDEEEKKVDEDSYDEGMTFIAPFSDPDPLPEIEETNTLSYLPFISYPSVSTDEIKEAPIIEINSARILAAGLRFKIANVATRLDNEVLFEGLETFEGQNQRVNQLPMGLLAKATVSDLFEDYIFEGGVRFPTAFNGSEYFMFFDNKKKLIDKRWGLYRRALTENVSSENLPFTRSKKEILIGMHRWSYPFDIYSSIRATASLRFDRIFFKSTNDISLNAPITRDKRLGLRLEYIFDNSLDYSVNIKHGSRAKVFFDAFNQFELDVIDGISFEASKGFTAVFGYDARHYIPILRESVLAFRSAGALSFGSKPNVYQLGDVNNTILPSFNQSIPIPSDRDFAFKANVNHLRGFQSNIRNGTTYILGNAELRIPLFRYFLAKDKGSSFIRDFHIVGFTDAGVAWYGSDPYDDSNLLNTVTVDGPVADIEATYFRDPIAIGYGLGVRTTLLGYFIRVDYAWGYETRQIQDPRWHFSFGYDF